MDKLRQFNDIISWSLLFLSLNADANVENLRSALLNDLKNRKTPDFAVLLDSWQKKYGSEAVPDLIKIASDRRQSDLDRYVSLMASAKLGGEELAPWLLPFLRDESWMIRSAALKSLGVLNNPNTRSAVLPLLRDRALVVRLDAIEALEKLRPTGSIEALLKTLEDYRNYHVGVAQWVPQRALNALVRFQARSIVFRLKPLLYHEKDPALQAKVIETIEELTRFDAKTASLNTPSPKLGLKVGPRLSDRVEFWKKNLTRPSASNSR